MGEAKPETWAKLGSGCQKRQKTWVLITCRVSAVDQGNWQPFEQRGIPFKLLSFPPLGLGMNKCLVSSKEILNKYNNDKTIAETPYLKYITHLKCFYIEYLNVD